MGRKKAVSIKKGGANYDIEGPLLSTNLYKELNIGNLENIKKSYDENLDKTREKLDRVSKDLNDLETIKNDKERRDMKLKEINNKKIIADNNLLQKKEKQAYNIVFKDFLGGFVGSLFINIGKLISTFFKAIYYSLYLTFNSGEGILFKIICFILVGFAITFIIMGFTSGLPSFDFSTSNNITKSIFKSDNDYNYTNINQGFITKLSNQLYSLVPNDYKYKFNSLGNSLSYITTGKNQYEDFLEPRDELKTGRNDGIFHIIKTDNSNFTHCLLDPKDIKINFDENYYNNIDYNNINSKLLDNIKYPISMTIPFTSKNVNGTSKYILDVDNQTYFRSNINFTETNVTSKIDKKHHIFIKNKDNIILNSFQNINYNKIADIIAIYSPKLLYKNYKEPIMTIKREYKSVPKYENVYYDINMQQLYYNKYSEKKYLFKETNIPAYYGIHRLFDQTGNGHDYIFDNGNDMDDKYEPMLIKRDEKYLIEFFSRSILYLSKKYPNIKSSITASIQFNIPREKFQRGVQYNGNKTMSILTAIYYPTYDNEIPNNNISLMSIDINEIHSKKFIFNNSLYNFGNYYPIQSELEESAYTSVSGLYLSSNDGNNMFHGYLQYLTITTSNTTQHYGLTRHPSTAFNIAGSDGIKRALCMKVRNNRPGYQNEYDLFIDSNNNIYRDTHTDNIETINKKNFEPYELDGYDDIIELYDQINTYNFFKPIKNPQDRYIPNLVNHDGGFKIRFFRKSLLQLDKEMIIKNIEASINIESENCDPNPNNGTESYQCKYATEFENIDKYMDLLATKNSSIIKLEFENNKKYDNTLKYNIKNVIEEKNNKNLSYIAQHIESINIDLDNPSLIECLGVVHDIRSDYDRKMDPLVKGKKEVKDDYIQKHAFIGFLDKLVITKRI